MRGKRAKQYKKVMGLYTHTFGFHEPYQTLVDSKLVIEATRCTMDLAAGLERTLRGKPKPMITQCSIRHLYALSPTEYPKKPSMIALAKTFERRLCGHHQLENPLPEKECIESVVVVKGANKHRYCVATQDAELRDVLNEVPGVPIIHIHKSVMIMEKISRATAQVSERAERDKLKLGIRQTGENKKRKRDEDEEAEEKAADDADGNGEEKKDEEKPKKKKTRGPKGPNPLAVKKKKKKPKNQNGHEKKPTPASKSVSEDRNGPAKKKRRRKHGKAGGEPEQSAGAASGNNVEIVAG